MTSAAPGLGEGEGLFPRSTVPSPPEPPQLLGYPKHSQSNSKSAGMRGSKQIMLKIDLLWSRHCP